MLKKCQNIPSAVLKLSSFPWDDDARHCREIQGGLTTFHFYQIKTRNCTVFRINSICEKLIQPTIMHQPGSAMDQFFSKTMKRT